MKKYVLLIFTPLIFMVSASAQENAIGLRLEGRDGFGGLISYQKWLGEPNRIEADLGFGIGTSYNALHLAGIYHWVAPLPEGFNWFFGPGVGITIWSSDADGVSDSGIDISVLGQIGVEYNFDFPLQLTLDLQPAIAIINSYGDAFDLGIGLGVRYVF